ncbi:MAG: 16S rRNA (uracil(1498)-N(3))-methyltransferase [Gammaproteobacteria bacterium HGW-Gammaproteobacteria-3]|nr:MAG: 16S rRNA (uracil(1498)-N(3))-methyltransferase [Gammaproteobacteria bacterium HGW-Gammaproteobacteria-3]
MRVSRLYVSANLEACQTLTLDDEASHYVRTVLRLKKMAGIILFDGKGGEYSGTVTEASRNKVQVTLGKWTDRSVESPLNVTLGLAVSRGDRMDLAVQKSVELGVNAITPLLTERCVVQLKGDKAQQRLSHWRKIMQHATEQCGRTLLPTLNPVTDLSGWLESRAGLKIFLDPLAETSLSTLTPTYDGVTLLSGPEGGFASHEREAAKAAGFIPVRLGHRILRAETAALAALSALQMLWGDFV